MDIQVAVTRSPSGGARAVLEASAQAAQHESAVLALVVATEGSTYVRPGAMALFAGDTGQTGWLSGGCLEPEIERRAHRAASAARLDWFEVDTREDEAMFSGSALGCRGKLRLALLPLRSMPRWGQLVEAWLRAESPLSIALEAGGGIRAAVGSLERRWQLASSEQGDASIAKWAVEIPSPPTVAIFGAGPETSSLLPALRGLGWIVTLIEQRPRWASLATGADTAIATAPQAAFASPADARFDAALVMHHHFELDREALAAIAQTHIGFVGLLGPARRREDLFRVLPADVRESLVHRLHSPVGLDLGGHGPESIALSIAAQLHAYRHSP